jgi:hypothetical protein
MYSTACKATHGFIILLRRLVRLVGDPALHAAPVKECVHYHRIEAAETGTAQVPRSCNGSVRAACLRLPSLGVFYRAPLAIDPL